MTRYFAGAIIKRKTDEKDEYMNTLIFREQYAGGSAAFKHLWNGLLRADRTKSLALLAVLVGSDGNATRYQSAYVTA